eukprot:6298779-Alexandrium_andersonii.AAC.1
MPVHQRLLQHLPPARGGLHPSAARRSALAASVRAHFRARPRRRADNQGDPLASCGAALAL